MLEFGLQKGKRNGSEEQHVWNRKKKCIKTNKYRNKDKRKEMSESEWAKEKAEGNEKLRIKMKKKPNMKDSWKKL